jgi:hypothetical protein
MRDPDVGAPDEIGATVSSGMARVVTIPLQTMLVYPREICIFDIGDNGIATLIVSRPSSLILTIERNDA